MNRRFFSRKLAGVTAALGLGGVAKAAAWPSQGIASRSKPIIQALSGDYGRMLPVDPIIFADGTVMRGFEFGVSEDKKSFRFKWQEVGPDGHVKHHGVTCVNASGICIK